jgi:KDO2-lipid IV(A) lauroyltransferase
MHVAQVFLEFAWAITQPDDRLTGLMDYTGMEHYHEAIAKGRGVVFLTLHQGNWELMPPVWGLRYGIPLHVVVRRMDRNILEEMATRFRTRGGNVMVPKQRAMRALLKAIRNNQRIGILLDQNVDWYDGVWADFFGSPACTNKGLALLALKTGVPVLPATNFRLPSGRFMTYIFPEVPPVITGDRTRDIEATTARYNKILEKMISICPEQWFWVHQRWKTRPYRFWPRELNL